VRGSLIFAFLAELHRLDVGRTARPPGLPSGMDEDFKEPVLLDRDDDGIGERIRNELPPVRVPCQVEPAVFEEERMYPAGTSPRSQMALVFHFKDLERLGLVDAATGEALIRTGDRLAGIYDKAGRLVQAIRTPPGLYATEVRPIGFGLHRAGPTRNLLLVQFDERRTAAPRES
jgi:hypothetical protein